MYRFLNGNFCKITAIYVGVHFYRDTVYSDILALTWHSYFMQGATVLS